MITTYIYTSSMRQYDTLLERAHKDGWKAICSNCHDNQFMWTEFGHNGLDEDNTLVIKLVYKGTDHHRQISLDHSILSE